jgi:hypothetical protein
MGFTITISQSAALSELTARVGTLQAPVSKLAE